MVKINRRVFNRQSEKFKSVKKMTKVKLTNDKINKRDERNTNLKEEIHRRTSITKISRVYKIMSVNYDICRNNRYKKDLVY